MKLSLNRFFDELNKEGLRFCHWKSNERLEIFLEGKEDLDLLFCPSNQDLVFQTFERLGAKRFEALPLKKYKDIYDFLFLDSEDGTLIHFHVHFGIDIGEKGLKRYRLPFYDSVLDSRIKLDKNSIWIISHAYEMLLLMLRTSLRFPSIVNFFYEQGIYDYRVESKAESEFLWLRNLVSYSDLEILAKKHFNDEQLVRAILKIHEDGFNVENILGLRKALSLIRLEWSSKSDLQVDIQYLWSRLRPFYFFNVINKQKPRKRISSEKGQVVVILGSDGAGKSTLVRNLAVLFSRKIDVCNVYLGLPKPSKSKHPKWALLFRKFRLFPVWNILTKKRNIEKANSFRKSGGLVLCDRFPQTRFPGIMDAPLLWLWKSSANPIKKLLAKQENRIFQKMSNMKVDLVIKLIVDSETSSKRGKHPIEMARKKTDVVNKLVLSNANRVLEINAEKLSINEVQIKASSAIWDLYN